jgi:hypothetical protein
LRYGGSNADPLRDRLVLGSLRTAVFLLLAGCLLRPVLLLSSAVPQRNVPASSRRFPQHAAATRRKLPARRRTPAFAIRPAV